MRPWVILLSSIGCVFGVLDALAEPPRRTIDVTRALEHATCHDVPGTFNVAGDGVWPQLTHAAWNGLTIADHAPGGGELTDLDAYRGPHLG